MEISFKVSDGTPVIGEIHEPVGQCRGLIVLLHGLGEHFGRYKQWISRFGDLGYAVTGADLPGHGRSGGKRGHVASYVHTEEIIDKLIAKIRDRFSGKPVILYGHSLGGGIVLRYLIRRQPELCCAVVTSPWLRLSFEPPRFKLWMAAAIKSIAPAMIQPSGLVVDHLSRDREVIASYVADELVHNRISVSLFNGAVSAADYCLRNAALLRTPLLLMHGSGDMITSPEGSRQFADASSVTDLKIWDGGYHELHNDIIKDEVFSYLAGWLAMKTGE
ncbi:MAG: alpha/beta hydrolase [Bacteroidales bacterium]